MADKSRRLLSLDTLRGFDMFFIMGVEVLLMRICSCFDGPVSGFVATQMDHAEWHGFTFMDTIFPLFLFISGISWTFSYAKQKAGGVPDGKIYMKVFRRTLILILFGCVYNGLLATFDFAGARYCSVLGRIGIAWMLAAVIYMNFNRVGRIVWTVAILAGYWLLLALNVAPDAPAGAGPFSLEGNIVGYVDRMIMPGSLYLGIFDPEGLLSNIPAVATALLGMFTGDFVRREDMNGNRKTVLMFCAAAVLLAAGLLWGLVFPVNKNLWTSSFVLVCAAYSIAMFALFYWIIDVRGYTRWTTFFTVIGLNSITIYMLSSAVNFSSISRFFFGGLASLLPECWGQVVLSAGYVLICWLLLNLLYRHKIFLKV